MTDASNAPNVEHEGDRNSIGDSAVNADPATLVLQYGDYKAPAADLPNKALAYLLQNGFSQSMTDAAAMTKEQKSVKTGNKVPGKDGKEVDETRPMTDAEVSAKVKELRDARFAKILEGTVGFRVGGPRASGIDAIIRAVATERLRAALAAKKLTLPQGKDKSGNEKTLKVGSELLTRDELISRYIAKNDADVRAEANRRMEANKDEAALVEDIGDLI